VVCVSIAVRTHTKNHVLASLDDRTHIPQQHFSLSRISSASAIVVITEGQRGKARYWGNYRVRKVAKLKSPVLCHGKQAGEVEFMLTIIQLEWEIPPVLRH
jgi:hypothetical protein